MPAYVYVWWCPECKITLEPEGITHADRSPRCSTCDSKVYPISVEEMVDALKAACNHMEREDRCLSRVECESCFIYEAIGELTVERRNVHERQD